jgi:hypothetical protein
MRTQKLKRSERFSARNSPLFLRLFSLNAFARNLTRLSFANGPILRTFAKWGSLHLDRHFA